MKEDSKIRVTPFWPVKVILLAVKELEKLISDMESGKFSLEETLLAYQRGAALLKHLQNEIRGIL